MQPMSLIQAKTKYGNMLLKVPKREGEANRILEEVAHMKEEMEI
jgi:hypothetical protein